MLFVGEQWLGSNARSLAMAFRKIGWLVACLDPQHFVPQADGIAQRALRRIQAPFHEAAFNQTMLKQGRAIKPAVVFVYKGTLVLPATLQSLRELQIPSAMYFPDYTLYAHGKNIVPCLPEYDQIFTAKSFGIAEMALLGARESHLVFHAADPDVHRPLPTALLPPQMQCDVAFIGAWSPHKEQVLAGLIERIPDLNLKVWGAQWQQAKSPRLQATLTHRAVMGDFYAAAIQSSKICLGLLTEKRFGASSGDLTTARTFEIPGCRTFMLHERTDEVLTCFEEGQEIECFADAEELAEKVRFYLTHDAEREAIAEAGYQRIIHEHLYEHRAREITSWLLKT